MKITDAVVRDLHVLVETGDASDDTRTLVEAWLAEHPQLATELRANGTAATIRFAADEAPAADGDLAALARVKHLLAMRTWSMALGFFFCALPLSFLWDSQGIHFLFANASPLFSLGTIVVGLVCWGVFVRVSRELRPTGF